jgi:hypothetical protein
MKLKRLETIKLLRKTPVQESDLKQLKIHLRSLKPFHIISASILLENYIHHTQLPVVENHEFEDLLLATLREQIN